MGGYTTSDGGPWGFGLRDSVTKTPDLRWVALDKHVLLVAYRIEDDDWGLRVGAVEGKDYMKEAASVVASGSKVDFPVQDLYFDDLCFRRGESFTLPRWYAERAKRRPESEGIGDNPEPTPPFLAYEALGNSVLMVAAEVGPDQWAAFIGAIEERSRDEDLGEVVRNGSAVPYELAEIFFKDYARDPKLSYRPDLRPQSGKQEHRFAFFAY